MSDSVLEKRVKILEERLSELEDKFRSSNELDTLSNEVLQRIAETEKWVKSGKLDNLVKLK